MIFLRQLCGKMKLRVLNVYINKYIEWEEGEENFIEGSYTREERNVREKKN